VSEDQRQGLRWLPGLVDAVAFACEIALLVTLAVAGTGLGHSRVLHVVWAILFPVLAAGLWGVWMAPTSARRLDDPARFVAQCVVFLAAGLLAALAGRPLWGAVFAVVSVAVFAATRATGSMAGSLRTDASQDGKLTSSR